MRRLLLLQKHSLRTRRLEVLLLLSTLTKAWASDSMWNSTMVLTRGLWRRHQWTGYHVTVSISSAGYPKPPSFFTPVFLILLPPMC